MLRVAKGSGGGGGLIPFVWMLRSCRFLNRSCMLRVAKGSGGGGFWGGWANSVRVDVAFMWMLRSCRFLNRSCMLRVAKGSGGGGGFWGGVG